MIEITNEQFNILQGFMLYIWNCNHNDEKSVGHGYYSELMDEYGISWRVQNTAAYLMEKRENGWKYFRSLLKMEGIVVV